MVGFSSSTFISVEVHGAGVVGVLGVPFPFARGVACLLKMFERLDQNTDNVTI